MVLLDQYYTQIHNFLTSLSIINQWFAKDQGETIQKLYELTSFPDPRTNPYWIHLAGEYTSNDTIMRVISIDTGEEIDFTKTVLDNHPKTKQSYRIGTSFYTSLCKRYPNQVDLIKSILYPVTVNNDDLPTDPREYAHYFGDYYTSQDEDEVSDINMLITSLDTSEEILFCKELLHGGNHPLTEAYYKFPRVDLFNLIKMYPDQLGLICGIVYPECPSLQLSRLEHLSLVNYEDSFLEDAERDTLVGATKDFLRYFNKRWAIEPFRYEVYYDACNWAIMWYGLHQCLLQTRISNLHTYRAHSYHIWEYLMSYGLADYRALLTRNQTTFLYRNIRYLHENRGSNLAMDKLIHGLLDEINVSLRSKILIWNTNDKSATTTSTPEVLSHRLGSDNTPLQDYSAGNDTLNHLFQQTVDSGLEPEYRTDRLELIDKLANQAPMTVTPVKVVEIQKASYDRRQYERYLACLIDTFLQLWSAGSIVGTEVFQFNELEIKLSLNHGEIFALINYLLSYGLMRDSTTESYNLIAGPNDYIPNKFWISHALVDSPVIPEDTLIYLKDGDTDVRWVKTDSLIDAEQVISMIDPLPSTLLTGSELIEALDNRYDALMFCDQLSHGTGDAFRFTALNVVRSAMVGLDWGEVAKPFTLDSEHPLVDNDPQTYSSWFANNKPLQQVVNYYTSSTLKKEELIELLTKAIFPIEESRFCGGREVTKEHYDALQDLFIKLCSYQVAFIDTDLTPTIYFTLNPVLVGIEGMEQTYNATLILNTNVEAFDDLVYEPGIYFDLSELDMPHITGVLTLQ